MPLAFTHVVEFDEAELVCRMMEAFYESKRPDFASANDVMAHMDAGARNDWLRVCNAVHGYLNEMMMKAQRVQ